MDYQLKAQEQLEKIFAYIRFLRKSGYDVSLSTIHPSLLSWFPEIGEYEVHCPSICYYMKSNKGTAGRCFQYKKDLVAEGIKEMTYRCCYAGVEDYVVPFLSDGELILYVNISGYRGGTHFGKKDLERVEKDCDSKYPYLYGLLNERVPNQKTIASFIDPLLSLIDAFYGYLTKLEEKKTGSLYNKMLSYIYEWYAQKITVEDLAKKLGYSSSYLRHLFKVENGKSFSDYLIEIRMKKAKELLRNTTLSIGDISSLTGYNDQNHFSYLFKKKTGLTPKEYRKG